MSTAPVTEILLGCDPQVRVVIIEDAGNLVLQVFAEDPAVTDIDALFFNLAAGVDASNLTIYPGYDEAIGSNGENVTGYDVATGSLNQMNNGAQIQDSYDVRLEFGTQPYTTGGDVDQAALTFYVDGGMPLTADSIDLSNMTAVINSDSGNGLALTGGTGNTGTDPESVYTTETVLSADFEGITYASQSNAVAWNDGWAVQNGEVTANGSHDGNLWFQSVAVEGSSQISFDARAPHTEYFENGGCYGDSLEVWVLVDGTTWALLDTFTVNADGTALVGDTTGQTITATTQTLTYEGGILDNASSVQLVLDADISAANEEIFVDNVEVTDTTIADGVETEIVSNTVASEDFEGITYASQSENVAWNDGWQVTNGEAEANGCNDGNLWFQQVAVNGDTQISFDARAPHTEYFENGGCYGDSLEVWALVDNSQWVLLDTFTVNAEGTALVGDTTGQTITADSQTISYSGGALENAQTVQLVLDADISASNEEIFVDNVEIATLEEVPVDDVCDNILVNGDMESSVAAGTWTANGDVEGWQNTQGGIEAWGDGFLGQDASSGDSFIELDRHTGTEVDSIYQDVQTEEGQVYNLEFDAAQRGLDSDSIEIYWNGELVDTVSPDGQDWETYTLQVTGTGGEDRLEFRELASENDSTGPLLDNVCLSADDDGEAECGQYDVTYDELFTKLAVEEDAPVEDTVDDTTDDVLFI